MDIDTIFSPGGEIDTALDNYSFREGQLEMARLVEKAIKEGKNLAVEAGTGIGKSFAYLAPIFMEAKGDEDASFIVATSTITLEKQLYDKDIPTLKKALSVDLDTAILFGRSNYLCVRRYEENKLERAAMNVSPSKDELAFEKWVETSETGASPELTSRALNDIFRSLASDEKDCPSSRCPFFSRCFFYNARRKAQKAQLVVTNHHLLLLDAMNRHETGKGFDEDAILPAYEVVVIDEAHHIENEATEIFSRAYSSERVARFLDYLTRHERRFGSASILDFLSVEEVNKGIGNRIKDSIAHIRTLLDQYDMVLSSVFEDYSENEVLLTPLFYERNRARLRDGEIIADEMRHISADIYTGYRENIAEENITYFELLVRYSGTISAYADVLLDFIRFSSWDDTIPYASRIGGRWEIRLAPMDTGPVLSKLLVSNLSSVIYSSATISVGDSFEYFSSRSGLSEEKERLLSATFDSPFQYSKNLMLLVPQDGKPYAQTVNAEYTDYVSSVVSDAILSSGGGALVLFTSKEMMKVVYDKVKGRIPDLLIQDERSSRPVLLKAFRNNKDSSLFAVSSFWEGIDAPGDTLRLVIIVKLPFSVPSTPIAMARSENIEKHGGRPFLSMAIPEAVLKLKQGIGRLIRSEDDRGVVLILDTRLIRAKYSGMMLSSLPECYMPEDTMISNIGKKIERFLF